VSPQKTHLAGIIPIAGIETQLDTKIPEILLPINRGFTAIQKSVFECAMAGCNTIWIVANDDLAPIVRKIVGEWIYDPVYHSRISRFSSEERREIPIYYVPIHPKDRDRRDSYGWSVLYGALSAFKVSYKISKWITPHKYYVSFPLSVYDVYQIREFRKDISHRENNFFLTYKGETVKDNVPLSFTLFGEDFKECRRAINKKTTREYLPPLPGQQYPSQRIPLQDRWSARYFHFDAVFEKVDESNAKKIDLGWYYDISNWSGYRDYLGSNFSIETPPNHLTIAHQHVKIPYKES
jgi:hypothetical protein